MITMMVGITGSVLKNTRIRLEAVYLFESTGTWVFYWAVYVKISTIVIMFCYHSVATTHPLSIVPVSVIVIVTRSILSHARVRLKAIHLNFISMTSKHTVRIHYTWPLTEHLLQKLCRHKLALMWKLGYLRKDCLYKPSKIWMFSHRSSPASHPLSVVECVVLTGCCRDVTTQT